MPRPKKKEIDHIDPRWVEGRDYQLVCGLDCPINYREEDWRRNTGKSNRFLPWRCSRDEVGTIPCEPGDLAFFLVGADIAQDISGEWILMEFLSEQWFEASRETCGAYQAHYQEESKLKEWRQQNPDLVKSQLELFVEGAKNWREANPDKVQENIRKAKEGQLKWMQENPEKVEETTKKLHKGAKKWREENPDRVKQNLDKAREAQQKWRAENPEKSRERIEALQRGVKEWREKNPEKQAESVERLKKEALKKFRCTVTGHISTRGPLTLYQKKRGIDPSNREPAE